MSDGAGSDTDSSWSSAPSVAQSPLDPKLTPRTQADLDEVLVLEDSFDWDQSIPDTDVQSQPVPNATPVDLDLEGPAPAPIPHSPAGEPTRDPTQVPVAAPLPIDTRFMTVAERRVIQLEAQLAEAVPAAQFENVVEYARAMERNARQAVENCTDLRAQLTQLKYAYVQSKRRALQLEADLTATNALLAEAVDPAVVDVLRRDHAQLIRVHESAKESQQQYQQRAWKAEDELADKKAEEQAKRDRANQLRRARNQREGRRARPEQDEDDDGEGFIVQANDARRRQQEERLRAMRAQLAPAFMRAHPVPAQQRAPPVRPPTAVELFGREPSPAVVQPPFPPVWIQRARDRHIVGQPAAAARATASSSDEDEEEKVEEDEWAFLDQE